MTIARIIPTLRLPFWEPDDPSQHHSNLAAVLAHMSALAP